MRLSLLLAAFITATAAAFSPLASAQPKPVAPAAAPVTTTGPVDINSAGPDALATLPGIGDARAKAIIAGRPYVEKADLVKSKVLTQSVFDGIQDKIALANINTSSAKDLAATLPGIGDVRAAAIVKARPYAKPADLVSKKVLTQPQLDAISPLIATR